jgi:hypothetical protein
VTTPSARYGYVSERAYSYRADAKRNSQEWTTENLTVEQELGLVFLQPVYVAQDNGTAAWTAGGTLTGTGTIAWQSIKPPKIGTAALYQPWCGTNAFWNATSISTTISPRFYLDLWMPHHYEGSLSRVDVVYPDSGSYRYKISIPHGECPTLSYSSDSGTNYDVVGSYQGNYFLGFGQWARLMLMQAGKWWCLGIDKEDWIRHYNPALENSNLSGPISVTGTAAACCVAWHPLKFRASGSGTGSGIARGFYNSQVPTVSVRGGTSTGQSMTGTVIESSTDGKSFDYVFNLSSDAGGDGYANTTPYMKYFQAQWPPYHQPVTGAPVEELTGMRAVREHIWFDPATLNIYAEASAEFHNESKAYSLTSGVRACELDLGYTGLVLQKRLTGYAGHLMQWDTSPGERSFKIQCFDRSVTLRSPGGIQTVNVPYMDGWCIYSAMRYLANYAGIQDQWLGFPICDGDIFNPCGHYLLPYGDEFHPLVRFAGGKYIWDCMQEIQRYCGYALYFDADGMLQFYPFIPSAPGLQKKIFTLVPEVDYFGAPVLNELMSVSRQRDMRRVRNDVVIVGMDPETWSPIRAQNVDQNSIFNPFAENYLGYRSQMVWADSMFCTEAYAQQAADAVYGVARVPEDRITLTGWMQPTLAPLDVIYIQDPTSAPYERPYWIMDIVNNVDLRESNDVMQLIPTCQITAQWLTPWG